MVALEVFSLACLQPQTVNEPCENSVSPLANRSP